MAQFITQYIKGAFFQKQYVQNMHINIFHKAFKNSDNLYKQVFLVLKLKQLAKSTKVFQNNTTHLCKLQGIHGSRKYWQHSSKIY